MVPEPLVGPKLKIERAKRHTQELETEISRFVQDEPYRIVFEDYVAEGGHDWVRARVRDVKEIPAQFSAIIGDVAHNLRAALDLVTTDLARATGATSGSALRDTYFPTATNRQSFEAEASRKIKRLPPAAQRFIRRLEPYTGGKGQAIRQLHEIDVDDKHTVLVTTGSLVVTRSISVSPVPGQMKTEIFVPFLSTKKFVLKDGVIVLSFVPTDAPQGIDIDTIFNIIFGDGQAFEGQPVIPTLQNLINFIERIIGIFERHFF